MSNPDDPMTSKEEDVAIAGMMRAAEWWIIAARGRLAFRWGPFTPEEVGQKMTEASDRHLGISVVGNMGRDIDWSFVDDLGCWEEGHPPRQPEYDATQRPINSDHASIDPKTGETSVSISKDQAP